MHALVVAAIFLTYMTLMGGLIAYACQPAREHRDDPPEPGDGEPELLPVVA